MGRIGINKFSRVHLREIDEAAVDRQCKGQLYIRVPAGNFQISDNLCDYGGFWETQLMSEGAGWR